jgi:hypothetical protein
MMNKFLDLFDSREDIARQFEIHLDLVPSDSEIIVAAYECASYEGDAFVLFRKGDQLFEVHGSHCSCYGLEGQWEPETTTAAAVRMRFEKGDSHYGVANSHAVRELISAHFHWSL